MPTTAPAAAAVDGPAFEPTPSKVYPVPTRGQLAALKAARGPAAVRELLTQRERNIRLMEEDPFNHGYELPGSWARADRAVAQLREAKPKEVKWVLSLGGNRAAKTEWAAKRVIQFMVDNPGARVWCLHSTQAASRQGQMPLLFKYLPTEWKPSETGRMRGGVKTKIVYSQAGGFTDDTFVLPNGSQCWFKFYGADVRTVEGVELDIAWPDELVTVPWLDAVSYRLATRAGIGLVTFTPVEGYTPTVGRFLEGAVTEEWTDVLELPKKGPGGEVVGYERAPLVQRGQSDDTRIVYFPTAENPFSGVEAVRATALKKGRNEILVRLYGVPHRVAMARFPRWSDAAHLVPEENLPKVKRDCTWYHIVDPTNGRNFAMIWAAVLPSGRVVVAREWPQPGDYTPGIGEHGDWAERGEKADGDPGPAQTPWGLGLHDYKDEILRVERELAPEPKGTEAGQAKREPVPVVYRFMDSRFGNAPTLTASERTTLIEQFSEPGLDLDFLPAFGDGVDDGVALINDWLAYNPEAPVGPENQPRLLVAENCRNTRFAIANWTGKDGQKGACKDFIDVLRYLVLADPVYCGDGAFKSEGGGTY